MVIKVGWCSLVTPFQISLMNFSQSTMWNATQSLVAVPWTLNSERMRTRTKTKTRMICQDPTLFFINRVSAADQRSMRVSFAPRVKALSAKPTWTVKARNNALPILAGWANNTHTDGLRGRRGSSLARWSGLTSTWRPQRATWNAHRMLTLVGKTLRWRLGGSGLRGLVLLGRSGSGY